MLGHTVKDLVTGFSGIVMGEVRYLSGCVQVLVAPPVDITGKIQESQWMDIQRVRTVDPDAAPLTLINENPGFEKQPPK